MIDKIKFNIALRNLVLNHMQKDYISSPCTMVRYSFGNKSCTIQMGDRYFSTEILNRDAAGHLSAEVFGDFNPFDLYKHISETYFCDLINIYCKSEL